MANINYNNRNYNIYNDTDKNLEFIMEANEVARFQELVRHNNNRVDDIPEDKLLTGTYLNQNTRMPEGMISEEIVANKVKFA